MAYGLVKLRHLREERPLLVAGRFLCVVAGLFTFVMSMSWQATLARQAGESSLTAHPLVVLSAALALMIAFSALVRRPLIILVVLPVAAPIGLYCLAGEAAVRLMGYGVLAAILGGIFIYRGAVDR